MSCLSCHLIPLKPLTLRMDSEKLLDVLTSLPVSHALLSRAMCFARSHPANHAICSFIDSSGYASGPIRRCLFIDYIIKYVITYRVLGPGVVCLSLGANFTDPIPNIKLVFCYNIGFFYIHRPIFYFDSSSVK